MKNFLIIGYGKTGSHLHKTIRESFKNIRACIIRNSRSKITNNDISEADLIFICAQDDKIGTVVQNIIKTGAGLNKKIIAHTSGALSSDELLVLKKNGALTASFHPVQTFMQKAKKNDRLFENIYIAIEGNRAALKELFTFARKINAFPFEIKKELKILHHISCVISSNYLISGISFLRDIYTLKNGFKKVNFFNIYMPLIEQTLLNIRTKGIEYSLTGPIARNDIKTIKKHITALKQFSLNEIIDYYKIMGLKTAKIARKKGSINKKDLLKLTKILGI